MKSFNNQIANTLKKLKKLRKDHHLTQKQLGEALSVSAQTISSYETGEVRPDLEMILRYCYYFDVSVCYLMGETDDYSAQDMEWLKRYKKSPEHIQQGIQLLLTPPYSHSSSRKKEDYQTK